MSGREIRIPSGVSWLYDRIRKELDARVRDLEEKVGSGVPIQEYVNFVGRIREVKRFRDITLPEIFRDLGSDEEEDDDET